MKQQQERQSEQTQVICVKSVISCSSEYLRVFECFLCVELPLCSLVKSTYR